MEIREMREFVILILIGAICLAALSAFVDRRIAEMVVDDMKAEILPIIEDAVRDNNC